MTPRQKRFVEAYARLKNAKAAAIAAGYSARSAAPLASLQMRNPAVQAALAAAGVTLDIAQIGGRRPVTRISATLTARQERFVQHYLALGNASEAARRAGYAASSAAGAADRLLHHPRVAAAIDAANAARAKELAIDAKRVLEEFACIAFADLRAVIDWDEDGLRVKPQEAIGRIAGPAIAEISERASGGGKLLKVKLFDKLRALELLAKHLGLFAKEARKAGPDLTIDGKDPRAVLRERLARLGAGKREA